MIKTNLKRKLVPDRELIAYLDSEQIVRGKAEISIFDHLDQYHYGVLDTIMLCQWSYHPVYAFLSPGTDGQQERNEGDLLL
jgi:hypothetical protein